MLTEFIENTINATAISYTVIYPDKWNRETARNDNSAREIVTPAPKYHK